MSDVYYRIIRMRKDEKLLTVVEMQDFDEYDYDHSRFLCEKGSNHRLMFETEQDAILFLNLHIKPENINPEFLYKTQAHNDSFYKD